MIYFKIGEKKVQPNNVQDALEKAILQNVESQIRQKVGSIRDPKTGEFPTIVCKGSSIDNLSFSVEGSSEMIELVKDNLGTNGTDMTHTETPTQKPVVFLSYASEDTELAERIAKALQDNGIDTWWSYWSIKSGDSIRQKIDEGLDDCTHFIVLCTPVSIKKEWVNTEIDSGFIKKMERKCRFIPIRWQLSASKLPLSLKPLYSPEIREQEFDKFISQLINDIHGVSRQPPLGKAPSVVEDAKAFDSVYSPAALAIAKIFVDGSKDGVRGSMSISHEEIKRLTELSDDDLDDGLYELSDYLQIEHVLGKKDGYVSPKNELFHEFDQFWKPWNPKEDALKLAADMVNNPNFPKNVSEIAAVYGWDPRRINPAITYLISMDYIGARDSVIPASPWVSPHIWATPYTRRFVQSKN